MDQTVAKIVSNKQIRAPF